MCRVAHPLSCPVWTQKYKLNTQSSDEKRELLGSQEVKQMLDAPVWQVAFSVRLRVHGPIAPDFRVLARSFETLVESKRTTNF